jgi:hypothetical protein
VTQDRSDRNVYRAVIDLLGDRFNAVVAVAFPRCRANISGFPVLPIGIRVAKTARRRASGVD